MKKTIALTLLLLSTVGSAFAAPRNLANNTVTDLPGLAIHGGSDLATVGVNPLGKLSTGVYALVNYESASAKLSSSYAIFTKHKDGSKIFGTANDATNIYWKASASKVVMANTECGTGNSNANFSSAGSWTSY